MSLHGNRGDYACPPSIKLRDRAKIDIIISLPNLASVREVRSFLGHAGVSSRTLARPPCRYPNYCKKMWSLSSTNNAYNPWSRSRPAGTHDRLCISDNGPSLDKLYDYGERAIGN
ncbi:hypothetical protein CR513_51592, partial [Mucuna pruriens]